MFVAVKGYRHTISALLHHPWMINRAYAESQLPMVVNLLKGQPASFVERTGQDQTEMPFCVDPLTMSRTDLYKYNPITDRYGLNPNIAPNSVGVIPITGPITKYNGACGEPGSITRDNWLMDMGRMGNIGSVVLLLDTPGGEVRAKDTSIDLLQKFSKPVLGYGDGMVFSLGVFYSCACKEFYFGNINGEFGSIGSLTMLGDFSGMLEKEGIKIHEIYAPQSVDKNKEYRDALKGDYTLIEAKLKRHVDQFIAFVIQTRGEKAKASVKEWSTGKTTFADVAVKEWGLADGIRSFESVISKAAWLAQRNK